MAFRQSAFFAMILFALIFFCCMTAEAQEASPAPPQVRAIGVVQVAPGAPIPGATVRLVHTATGQAWVTWTDENGKFDLPSVPAGKYRIEVEQLGFQNATVETEFNPPATEPAAPAANAKPPAAFAVTLRVAPLAAPAAETPAQPSENKSALPAGNPPTGAAANPGAPNTAANKNAQVSPAGAAQPAPAGAKPGQPGAPGQRAANPGGPNGQRPGGFQQVNINGQNGLSTNEVAPPAGSDFGGALGEAASADAVLAQGTVGRGSTAGMDMFAMIGMMGGFGPGEMGGQPSGSNPFGGNNPGMGPGGPGAPGGMPGGIGNIVIMGGGMPGGGPPGGGRGGQPGGGGRGGQQQGGRGGQAGGRGGQEGQGGRGGQPQRQQFGEGAGGLYGLQRVLRQQLNRVHFSFFDRYGNSVFDARPYSLTQANPPKIGTYRTNWGASLGGPLVIPKVYNGKDKTFFFLNYSGMRSRTPVDSFSTVPTDAERGGDFGDRNLQLFDPASNSTGSRTAFGSSIPTGRISSVAQGLLQFIPEPNLPGLVQNFHFQTRVPGATDAFSIRVLHTISPKLNARVIYSFSESRSHGFSNFPQLESNSDGRGQNVQLGLTQNWSPRFINDTSINWSRNRSNSLNNFAFLNDIAGNLGISGISTAPIDFGLPQVSLTNFTGLNDPVPALRRNQSTRTMDNVTWIRPKHTFRFGAEIRRNQTNTITDPTPRGLFSFTGLQTAQLDATGKPIAGTGSDFADFLLGLPQSTSIRFGGSNTYFRNWWIIGFVNDDWRIHPRFTLTYGLRWEGFTPPNELQDHIANLIANSDFTQVATVTPGQTSPFDGSVQPNSLVHGNYKSFAPRLAIAWRPKLKFLDQKHSLVVRAGYGMFYNLSIYNSLATSMANQPPFAQAQTQQTSAAQILTFQDGFPPAPPSVARNTIAVDPFYRPGYAEIWNLSLEQQLSTTVTLDLTYTGTKGNHLDEQRAPNRLAPGLVQPPTVINALGFTYNTSGASSIYHALQARLQRRFNKGLMLQGTYTYSKSIDNASSIGGGGAVVIQDELHPELDRGLSSFDIRHQISAIYSYELPFGERKKWAHSKLASAIFGSWTVNGNTAWRTGSPYTPTVQGFTADNSGAGNSFSERADQVGNPNVGPGLPLLFFNTAAFVQPPTGRFGNAARGTITGPGSVTLNLGLGKGIRFGKDNSRRIDFRWDCTNLLNHPNFSRLSTVINSSTYGRVLDTGGMRTMNFQIRVNF